MNPNVDNTNGIIGDHEFSKIFTQFYPRMCFFAHSLLKDRTTAEEIVADVFETIWIKRKLNDVELVGPYLYKAVLNRCLNYKNKAKIRTRHHNIADSLSPKEEEIILEKIYQTEAFHELYQAIENLPPQCRQVINLSYRDGKKIVEIAEELNISQSTVKTQRSRGIIILRKLLSSRALSIALLLAKTPL